jgi:hypothetical protein
LAYLNLDNAKLSLATMYDLSDPLKHLDQPQVRTEHLNSGVGTNDELKRLESDAGT